MTLSSTLRTAADELGPDLTRLRHQLHRAPEIGLQLPRTQQTLLEELDGPMPMLKRSNTLTDTGPVCLVQRRSTAPALTATGTRKPCRLKPGRATGASTHLSGGRP